jgi:hypothetical protein
MDPFSNLAPPCVKCQGALNLDFKSRDPFVVHFLERETFRFTPGHGASEDPETEVLLYFTCTAVLCLRAVELLPSRTKRLKVCAATL